MNGLKAVIVDDEQDSIAMLRLQLERHCNSIESVITYTSSEKALRDIPFVSPDIVFLDVEMPRINGFEILEQLMPLKFNVVFVTAYSQYAIRAFKFNALDYLLKPINGEDLKLAMSKINMKTSPMQLQFTQAHQYFKGAEITSMAFSSQTGVTFLSLKEILYAEASNNYSYIFLTDGTSHLISKTLKEVQALLEESHFLRIHRQYIVNLNCVKHFNKNEGILTMSTKKQLPIVRNQFDRFMERYPKL
jgi:two-component system LytT family response regulator